jgi:hypothetical protein
MTQPKISKSDSIFPASPNQAGLARANGPA